MKLEEIRRRTAYNPNALPTVKAATRMWVCGMANDFPLALTLTLKQTIVEESRKVLFDVRLRGKIANELRNASSKS